jgi:Protein of unknown function (DUF2924)
VLRGAASAMRASASPRDAAFESEIEALPDLSLEELRGLWQDIYDYPAPAAFRRKLLARGIAYERQAKRYGGLSPSISRRLQRVANDLSSGKPPARSAKLKTGTRLVRDWNGTTHVVEVVDGGFVWREERYRSLSVVARAITGARWSGPRFFGLKAGP